MVWPFKCKHPANRLGVQRKETVRRENEDFDVVTYHLVCRQCDKTFDLSYASMIGGIDEYLKRGSYMKRGGVSAKQLEKA